jgi:hypothetical protein
MEAYPNISGQKFQVRLAALQTPSSANYNGYWLTSSTYVFQLTVTDNLGANHFRSGTGGGEHLATHGGKQ